MFGPMPFRSEKMTFISWAVSEISRAQNWLKKIIVIGRKNPKKKKCLPLHTEIAFLLVEKLEVLHLEYSE